VRLGHLDLKPMEENGIRQVCAVADLDGDARGDIAILVGSFSGSRILFVSSADGALLGEHLLQNDFRGATGFSEVDRLRMLHVPDLDADGFGQLLVPRVQTLPDGQPQCTLMLYDLKRLR